MFYLKRHNFGAVEGYAVGIAPTGKPIKSVYLYTIGSIVIDTGPHHLRKQVAALLEGRKIQTILLTHHHEDHSGNAAELQEQLAVPVYMHPYGVNKLSQGFGILPYQHLLFGKAPSLKALPCPEIIEDEKFTIRAIHTPGHSKDHTVYLLADEGWLFSGDLWVGEKIQFFRADERIDQQIDSLRKIVGLEFEALFCGHRPSTENGKALIKGKLDYLVSFQEQVIGLFGQGLEVGEIVRRLRRKNDLAIRLFTMGNASFSHMVRSALNPSADS